jgi:ASC-1-like (ASCH) protein
MATPIARDIECCDPWFSLIRAGLKTVEGRKASPTWTNVQTGDRLRFRNGRESFLAEVLYVTRYAPGPDAVRRYVQGETLWAVMPGVPTIEAAVELYLGFPGWTRELTDEFGMLAIHVRVVRE